MTVDRLTEYGLERMDDDAIRALLDAESTGVLGLPTGDAPYLLPLSYDFDGDERLYFAYLLGPESRKRTLSDRADRARFLVYDVETQFRWQSATLAGPIDAVPEGERERLGAVLNDAWRPNLLQSAGTSGEVAVYRLTADEWTGVRQTGLAPDFRENIDP